MEEQKATKVTLYLPPELHRQLRICSAVEGEAMSSIAKRAIDFYLAHSDLVMVRDGELIELARRAALTGSSEVILNDADLPERVGTPESREESKLVVC